MEFGFNSLTLELPSRNIHVILVIALGFTFLCLTFYTEVTAAALLTVKSIESHQFTNVEEVFQTQGLLQFLVELELCSRNLDVAVELFAKSLDLSNCLLQASLITGHTHIIPHNIAVNRGYYTKTYVHTDYPVWFITLEGSVPAVKEDLAYFKPQVEMLWKFRIPPLGTSQLDINAGTIIGKVPWMMLQMYPGNATPIMDQTAFSCMEYFEFGSDTWATLLWYHCFNGFFLGKIPLISKLQLREEVCFKMAYGTLSDRNNGSDPRYGAMMKFPQWEDSKQVMTTLGGMPYMEAGFGISNIFRVLRVDFIWRLSHREVMTPEGVMRPARRLFTVNVGAEVKF